MKIVCFKCEELIDDKDIIIKFIQTPSVQIIGHFIEPKMVPYVCCKKCYKIIWEKE